MSTEVDEEYNTGRTACISENIHIVRKQMCNKEERVSRMGGSGHET